MEDVISISSGSEEDSDIVFVSVCKESNDESKAFVREWSNLKLPHIDLTAFCWAPQIRGDDSPLVVANLSDNSLSDGLEVEPLSSPLGLATSEGEQKTPSYSPCTSCEKGEKAQDSLGNSILDSLKDSPCRFPVELREKQKPQDCLGTKVCPLKLHCRATPECLLENEGAPESPSIASPEPAWIQQRLNIEEKTPGSPRSLIIAPNIPNEITSVARSQMGYNAEKALQYKETKVESSSTESKLHQTEKEALGNCSPDYSNVSSPLSPYSPYFCPSEIDPVLFSDDSTMHESQKDSTYVYSPPPTSPVLSQDPVRDFLQEGVVCTALTTHRLPEAEALGDVKLCIPCQPSPCACPHSPEPEQQSLQLVSVHQPSVRSVSPTYTEFLAGDSPDWLVDDIKLPTDSPPSPPSLPSSDNTSNPPSPNNEEVDCDACEYDPGLESYAVSTGPEDGKGEELSGMEMGPDSREASRQDRQYVSRTQLNKMKRLMGRRLHDLQASDDRLQFEDDGDENENEESVLAEPICRQSLNLVYSTIEEHYPESTLQLLSDFLHPCFYPPANVISHLIKGILLNPNSNHVLVIEAYDLLMRIQKNHPATQSTVQWDWALLASFMDEQSPDKRLPSTVLCLLLQYVLQTLDDDFQLCLQRLNGSIAKATLSCYKQIMQVRDVINWLVAAVTRSTGDPRENTCETEEGILKERDENLKIVLILQKMLVLALEVDNSPTYSSNKLSHDLFQTLISTVPHRCHRLLLLQTVESRLLQCNLLELLLEHACTDKTELPMSLSLLLHFLQSTTLPPDPADGAERWRRWSELVKLLWMLLLSYEEVTEGHLQGPITQRANYKRAPIWMRHDDITQMAVQEAAESFLSRASADMGLTLPPQVQESFSYLQEHLLYVCRH